jgi:hypothetical protein
LTVPDMALLSANPRGLSKAEAVSSLNLRSDDGRATGKFCSRDDRRWQQADWRL